MFSIHVKCLDKSETEILMAVWIIDSQVDIFIEEPFYFMQIFRDANMKKPGSFSIPGIEEDLLYDSNWLFHQSKQYFPEVILTKTERYPAETEGMSNEEFNKFWKDLDKVPYAEFRVLLNDPELIKGIRKGQAWDSMAGYVQPS